MGAALSGILRGWGWICLACAAAGWIANRVGVPAAWMVGPMVVALVAAVRTPTQRRVHPRWFAGAQSMVGMLMASAFHTTDLPILVQHWYAVLMVGGGTLLISIAIGQGLARATRSEGMTSVVGLLPGGASGMVAMSDSVGADPKLVAVSQYIRLILVVFSASLVTRLLGVMPNGAAGFLPTAPHFHWWDVGLTLLTGFVGTWLGVRLRIPAGALLGAILAGLVVNILGLYTIAVPSLITAVSYSIIGIYVGSLFDRASLRHAGSVLPHIFAATLTVMAGCAALGWLLNVFTGYGFLTCFLATSPGGLDSVTLMAMGGGANVALVLSLQTVRLFSIVLLGPLIVKGMAKRRTVAA